MNNNEYKRGIDNNGKVVLMRYDDRYKVWVKLHFSEVDIGVSQYIKDTLGRQYIENEVEKSG